MRNTKTLMLISLLLIFTSCTYYFYVYPKNTSLQEERTIISLFQSVLLNEQQFYNSYLGLIYLNDLPYEYPQPTSIAVFDINGDGVPEVIVNFNYTLKYVFYYYDGKVFGNEFGIRSMNAIMTDGRFFLSPGGAGNFGVGELILNGDSVDILTIYSFDAVWVDRNNYPYEINYNLLNGVSITDEEFEIWYASVTSRELIDWHPFTSESIQNLSSLITPRYIPQELSDAITLRIHPDMPEFTITRIAGDYISNAYYIFPEPREVKIIITDENGVIIQEINNLTQSKRSASGGLSFNDYNFDGYLDMRLMRWQDNAGGLLAHEYYWLWDTTLQQFVMHEQLMKIGHSAWLKADQDIQRIYVGNRYRGGHSHLEYEYRDGEFFVTRRSFMRPFDSSTRERYVVIIDAQLLPNTLQGVNNYEVDILIETIDGEVVQEILGLTSSYRYSRTMTWDIEIDPFNPLNFHVEYFWGAIKMGLRFAPGGSLMNDPHYFWLWDSDVGQFVENRMLEEMSCSGSFWIDGNSWLGAGLIHTVSRISQGLYVWNSYNVVNGELILVKTRERVMYFDGDDWRIKYIVYDHTNDTETVIFENSN